MRFVVSACLAGMPCRYDGTAKPDPRIEALFTKGSCLAVCPEELGGLGTPREPCEICSGKVLTQKGKDCTAEYGVGARRALGLVLAAGCKTAILKSQSPSCGVGSIYDGTFRRRLVPASGIFASLLLGAGLVVFTEETLPLDWSGD